MSLGHKKKQYPVKLTCFVTAHSKTAPFPEFSQRVNIAGLVDVNTLFRLNLLVIKKKTCYVPMTILCSFKDSICYTDKL